MNTELSSAVQAMAAMVRPALSILNMGTSLNL
jgi:hypothetical protein